MTSKNLITIQMVRYQEFLQKCESNIHVDSAHKNEDSRNCRICDKSFSHKWNVKDILKKFMRFDQPDKRA